MLRTSKDLWKKGFRQGEQQVQNDQIKVGEVKTHQARMEGAVVRNETGEESGIHLGFVHQCPHPFVFIPLSFPLTPSLSSRLHNIRGYAYFTYILINLQ